MVAKRLKISSHYIYNSETILLCAADAFICDKMITGSGSYNER